jgi:hypothetical protein
MDSSEDEEDLAEAAAVAEILISVNTGWACSFDSNANLFRRMYHGVERRQFVDLVRDCFMGTTNVVIKVELMFQSNDAAVFNEYEAQSGPANL